MTDFPSWLKNQLNKHGYTNASFARKVGVPRSSINGLATGYRTSGKYLLGKIAEGLNLPLDEVFRAAGLLPPDNTDTQVARLVYLISLLSEQERDYITTTIEALISKHHETKKIT